MAVAAVLLSPFSATGLPADPPTAADGGGRVGIEQRVDPHVRPGDDFFAYANGAWLQRTVLPPGKDRWTVRDDLNGRAQREIAAILEDAATAPAGSLARLVGDYRAAARDQAAIDARGFAPLAPLFARIDAAPDQLALARLLGSTLRTDVDPLGFGVYTSASVLGLAVEHSIHGETNYDAFLVQGGLALGERDAYLGSDPGVVERRSRYRAAVARVLALAGFDRADLRAASVLTLETAIAATQAMREASAVDRNADNRWSRADFARQAPGLDWSAFFEAAGLGRQETVVVWQPSAVKGVAALVASRPLAEWQDYLRFHALVAAADVLPSALGEAAADLRGDLRSRDERVAESTLAAMAGPIGELYARRFFPPVEKARVRDVIARVGAAFRDHVANASWLSPASRTIALAKLDRLYIGVGYPERFEDWSDLRIDPNDAFGNAERLAERTARRARARLAEPYDPQEWVLTPQTVGAVLIFQQNAYLFAAALLQPPKYDPAASDAAVYGSIGAIIGHDMSHFVDVLGADYEADGRMRRWWTAEDAAQFDAAAEPLVRQFSTCQPLPGQRVDGRLTRTENVADLAGLTAAFEAYRKSLGPKAADRAFVHRSDREFFLAFAQAFGAKMNEQAMQAQLATDHAPETCRMQTVRNLDAWYEAFDVTPGQELYLAPAARVRVW